MKKSFLPALLAFLPIACSFATNLPFVATPTPILPPTLTPSPTPLPLPTPTPVPTPLPAARVAEGDRALFYGDWDGALAAYETAEVASLEVDIQAAARLGKGRARFLNGDYPAALADLRHLLENYPDSLARPAAYFHLGQVYAGLGRNTEAADAYQTFSDLQPGLIDSYALELKGDALSAAGDYTSAAGSYQAALENPRQGDSLSLMIKLARAHASSGDYTTAIELYQDAYQRSDNEYTRAQMDLLMGQAYIALGQTDSAYAAFVDAVQNYPLAFDSYTSLVILVDAGYPVSELDRGVVDYFAGKYGLAIGAFDRYLASGAEQAAKAIYYKGLALRALGEHMSAIYQWDTLIQGYQDSDLLDEAHEQKAYTLWAFLDQYGEAAQALLDFTNAAPVHPRAPELLFEAARILERGESLEAAAQNWERLASAYPGYARSQRGMFLAGVSRYRLGDHANALATFQRALQSAGNIGDRAAAFLWIGKSQEALGDTQDARASWEQAAATDPTGYYSERARDILSGRAPFTPPQMFHLAYDKKAEQAEAEIWIRQTFNLAPEIDLSVPGQLLGDTRFQRGTALWHLGMYNQARLEFEELRKAVQSDPADTYRLANYLVDLGLYRSGIMAARQVLTLAGMDDAATMRAPAFFNHIRFGCYFAELVLPMAQKYDLHPLLLFSLIRQESLFEGFVQSSAGARGLMQIIPSTGQSIASQLGWPPNYTDDDLYRPLVSVTLGADYLDAQRSYLNGDMYAALAAYNGGPGNSTAWKRLSQNDPDLFLEVIRFDETRRYITSIYEVFTIYRRLYDLTP